MESNWGLLKRIWAKKASKILESLLAESRERVDLGLPLGLRIGGMVETPIVDFVLGGKGLKIKHPGENNSVLSYGIILSEGARIHRFYLGAEKTVYMLQIVADERNNIDECKLFMPFDDVYPPNADAWDFWLNPQEGYIGLNVFQTKDGVLYDRVWSPDKKDAGGGTNRVAPFELTETIYHEPFGRESETVKYMSMLYGRSVDQQVDEYLLLSAVEDEDGASVQIMAGISIQPSALKVI